MLATVRSTPNSELLQQAPGKQETRLKNDFAFGASICLRWWRKPGSLPAFGQNHKSDYSQWQVDEAHVADLVAQNITVMKTSAEENAGVEKALAHLARRMVQPA